MDVSGMPQTPQACWLRSFSPATRGAGARRLCCTSARGSEAAGGTAFQHTHAGGAQLLLRDVTVDNFRVADGGQIRLTFLAEHVLYHLESKYTTAVQTKTNASRAARVVFLGYGRARLTCIRAAVF